MNSSGNDGGNAAAASSSIVASFLSTGNPIRESDLVELLKTICKPESAESEELVSSGAAARLCDVIVDAANKSIAGVGGKTSTSSYSNSSSVLTSLRILRNLCASGSKAGDAMAPTGIARAAAVLAAVGGGRRGAGERGEGVGGGAAGAAAAGAAAAAAAGAAVDASADADAHRKVSLAAAQLLANLAACSAAGAEAVWREAVVAAAGVGGGGGVKGNEAAASAAGASAAFSPSFSSPSFSSFLAVAARQGGPRVAGPVASAADAALLRQVRKGADPNDDGGCGGDGDAAVRILCSSSPLLSAVVDGLRLESGSLHHGDEGEEDDDEIEKSKREKDAAATAVAARAVARLLRSVSFRCHSGLSFALEALQKGPPVRKERKETALRLLGHVVAEEGCFGFGFGSDGGSEKTVVAAAAAAAAAAASEEQCPFDSFASAILEALDSPAASPGEVQACLALLREVAARDDDDGGADGESSSSPTSSSGSSVVAALARNGLVPRLLERIASLPPVRGQEEAEAESDARGARAGAEGEGGEKGERGGHRGHRRRRLPRYAEERADAVAVLANALHRRSFVADSLLRCEGGAELLLAQCGAVGAEEAGEGEWRRREKEEAEERAATATGECSNLSPPPPRNPLPPTVGAFAREWALWALRNLTEASEEARKLLSDLRPVKAVPSEELERAGLRLELDEGSGKFELRKIRG